MTAAVTLALCGFTGMNLAQAASLTTQDAVDEYLNQHTADSVKISNTESENGMTSAVTADNTELTVGRTSGQDLTLEVTGDTNNPSASAAVRGSQGSLTFRNLGTLQLTNDTSSAGAGYYYPTSANLYAGGNGTITVDSSVGQLNASNTKYYSSQYQLYNLQAKSGGQIHIQAPTVTLARNYLATGIYIGPNSDTFTENNAGTRTTGIYIGTDEHPIDSLTLDNAFYSNTMREFPASTTNDLSWDFDWGDGNYGIYMNRDATNPEELSIQANNININYSKIGILINGASGGDAGTILRIGKENNWAGNLDITDVNNAIVADVPSQTDIYAQNFRATTRASGNTGNAGNRDWGAMEHGLFANRGAIINVHTGTGENGMRIQQSGMNSAHGPGWTHTGGVAIMSQGEGSIVNIKEGDVHLTDSEHGLYAYGGSQINFGNNSDGSQGTENASGDLSIANTDVGILSLTEDNRDHTATPAEINLHVNNLHLDDGVNTPLVAGGLHAVRYINNQLGNINIRTDGTAYLSARDYRFNAIQNYGRGSININTEGNGDTQITGDVYNDYAGHIGISLNSANSFLHGSAFDSSLVNQRGTTDIIVKNGAQWVLGDAGSTRDRVYYQSFIHDLSLHDGGIVDLSQDGATAERTRNYNTLGVSSLTNDGGAPGTLVFGTNLAASAEDKNVTGHSDQLIIRDSSRGNYNIMINDHSNITGQPVDDGYVLLVRDQSADGQDQARFQGLTSDSANGGLYVQRHADLQNGGLFTKTVEITDEAPSAANGHDGYTGVPTSGHNWYARLNGSFPPNVPVRPTDNARHNISFASGRYANLFLEEDTLRKRIGDLREGKDRGIWVRMYRGKVTADGMGGDMTYNTYQIGFDHEIKKTEDSIQYAGISYHHRDMNYNVSGFTHDSEGDADVGSLYWTKLKNDGQYLDVVGRFGRMKGKMDTYGEFPERGRWSSPYQGLSVEYGKQFKKENGWYLEPQAQLTYSHLSRGSYTTTQGTHANLSSINSLIGRIGTTFGRKTQSGDYYGMLFWHHEFDGNASCHFLDKNGDTLDGHHDYGGTWLTVGVGGEYRPSDKFTIYADVQKSFGGDVRQKWVWNAGMRWNF